MHLASFPDEEAYDKNRAHRIGDNGCDGYSCYIQMKDDDKEEIESRVEHAGDHKTDERSLRIADAPQDRSTEVVEHDERHAEEVYPQILHCKRKHGFWRIHHLEKGFCDDESKEDEEQAADERDGYRCVDCSFSFLPISAADIS